MNREILFRGKRIDNGEWVYGYYLPWHAVTDLQGNEPYAQIFEEHKVKGKYVTKGWVRVKFNTVGQYTGLTDKNGNKIFDGDIVKDKYGIIFEIMFSGNGYFVAINNDYWEFINDLDEIEVIGNIHDNPELLEDEK